MKLTINGQTGAELESVLIAMNFTIPEIQPYEPTPYPPYMAPPARPDFTNPVAKAQWKTDFLAYQVYVKNRGMIMNQVKVENAEKLAAYFRQFEDFAAYLSLIFDPVFNYTFLQAAHRLMGYACQRPLDPIRFICY